MKHAVILEGRELTELKRGKLVLATTLNGQNLYIGLSVDKRKQRQMAHARAAKKRKTA